MVKLNIELPQKFLNEEICCDYTVTSKVKKAWAIELDLLNEFSRVCNKYNLTYYAIGGTLLGAIRHQGFIPWDDDIDLIMPRKDYQKLLEVGKVEFKHPYFLSSPLTEYRFWRAHAQLRNSETLGTIESDKHRNNNKGLFIDIFVLDNVPDDISEREEYISKPFKNLKWYYRAMDYKHKHKGLTGSIVDTILKLFISDTSFKSKFNKFNDYFVKNGDEFRNTVAHTALKYREKVVWKKESFRQIKKVKFEFTEINIPVGYDEILKKHYGDDYMQLPTEHPDPTHGGIEIDVDKSYKEYYGEKQ